MPKIKTRRTIAKRMKVTSRGKLLRRMTNVGHLKTKKSRKRKRKYKRYARLIPAVEKKLKQLLV